MQFFRPLAAVADQQNALQDASSKGVALSEPQPIDESLLAQISGGAKADGPGSGW